MSTRLSTLSTNCVSQSENLMPVVATAQTRLMESMKALYQADQQVKYLHLQAEVESLLIQLQSLKQQRTQGSETVETTYEAVKQ